MIDGLVLLAAVAFVLAAMKHFGWLDLGTGTLQVVDGDSLRLVRSAETFDDLSRHFVDQPVHLPR